MVKVTLTDEQKKHGALKAKQYIESRPTYKSVYLESGDKKTYQQDLADHVGMPCSLAQAKVWINACLEGRIDDEGNVIPKPRTRTKKAEPVEASTDVSESYKQLLEAVKKSGNANEILRKFVEEKLDSVKDNLLDQFIKAEEKILKDYGLEPSAKPIAIEIKYEEK